jgi:O-antigen ligase
MIAEKPLTGFGWGKFGEESPEYFRQSLDYPLTVQRQSHNVYLTNVTELGLPGGLLWFGALMVALIAGVLHRGPPWLRPWQLGLAAFSTCYLVTALTTPLGFALPTMLLWMWAGITWIGIRQRA